MTAARSLLVTIQGAEPGRVHELPQTRVVTIGRLSRNTIEVGSPTVSRFHCEIAWVNGQWLLSDLNSKRGTFVNGQRIAARTALQPGDVIRLGSTVLRFDVEDAARGDEGEMDTPEEGELDGAVLPEDAWELDGAARKRSFAAYRLRMNVFFMSVMAVAVTAGAVAVLRWAHARQVGAASRPSAAERSAADLYGQALAALEAGNVGPGLAQLEQVAGRFPGTTAARDASDAFERTLWQGVEERLALVARREAEQDYAAALAAYAELEGLPLTDAARGVVTCRRGWTVRLARAAFQCVERQAGELLGKGDRDGAARLYERTRTTIGLAELADQAAERLAELQSST